MIAGGLLLALVGFGIALFGLLTGLAAGMSSGPTSDGKGTCVLILLGLILFIVGLIWAGVEAFT